MFFELLSIINCLDNIDNACKIEKIQKQLKENKKKGIVEKRFNKMSPRKKYLKSKKYI